MNRVEALRSSQVFKVIPEQQLAKLAALGEEQNLSIGWELIREHEEVTDLYLLVQGTVKVTKRGDNGDDETIATLGSGSYFGEVELLQPGHPANVTVSAAEPCTAVIFPHDALREACESNSELGFYFYRAIAEGLARRLVRTTSAAAHFQSMVVKHH